MSFKKIAILIICIFCVSTSSQAKIKFTIAPEVGIMGGTTEYELNGIFNDTSNSGAFVKHRITSLLEFPLDVTIGGFSTILQSIENPRQWSITLKYLTNFNDPSGKMVDTDWDEKKNIYPYTKWSFSESDAEMNMTILDAEVKFLVAEKPSMDISIIAGGRYQKVEQNMFGLEGWQKSFDVVLERFSDTQNNFTGFENVHGLYYKIEYKQFKVGLQSDLYLSNKIRSQLKFAFAPASFKDVDDHLLRNKLSTGQGDGNGFHSGFNLRYDQSDSKLSFIQLSATYNYYTSNGSQTQTWYGDDPSSPEDDTGDSFSGIPHTVRTKQYTVSLQIGIEF